MKETIMNFEDFRKTHNELENRLRTTLRLAVQILKYDEEGNEYNEFNEWDDKVIENNGITISSNLNYGDTSTFIPKEWIDSALDPINLPEADDNEGWATYETRKKESEANIAKLEGILTNIKMEREKKQEEDKRKEEEDKRKAKKLRQIKYEQTLKEKVEAEKRQYEALKAKYEGK